MSISPLKYKKHIKEERDRSITRRERVRSPDRERKALEGARERLSPPKYLDKLKEFEDKFGHEIRSRSRHIGKIAVGSAAVDRSKSRLFQLLQIQRSLQQRAWQARARIDFEKDKKQFVDRAFGLKPEKIPKIFVSALGHHVVEGLTKTRLGLLPCIDRLTRKEVMFALKHAGHGHRKKKRKGPLSHIRCI